MEKFVDEAITELEETISDELTTMKEDISEAAQKLIKAHHDAIDVKLESNNQLQMQNLQQKMSDIVDDKVKPLAIKMNDKLSEKMNSVQKQIDLLEKNINESLKNIQENGVKANMNTQGLQQPFNQNKSE